MGWWWWCWVDYRLRKVDSYSLNSLFGLHFCLTISYFVKYIFHQGNKSIKVITLHKGIIDPACAWGLHILHLILNYLQNIEGYCGEHMYIWLNILKFERGGRVRIVDMKCLKLGLSNIFSYIGGPLPYFPIVHW